MLPVKARVNLGAMAIKGVLRIPQRFSISGASSSDCLVSYPGHASGVGSYPCAKMKLMYSTSPRIRNTITGSSGNEEVSPELESRQRMEFNVIKNI